MLIEELRKEFDVNDNVIVKVGGEWCGPCKRLEPILEMLRDKYESHIKYISIDCDDSPEIVSEYKIRNIPTILFIKQGEVFDKTVGGVTVEVLEEKIEKLISE